MYVGCQKLLDATCGFFKEDGELIPDNLFDDIGYDDLRFNITEDMHIDEYGSDGTTSRLLVTRPEVQLPRSYFALKLLMLDE